VKEEKLYAPNMNKEFEDIWDKAIKLPQKTTKLRNKGGEARRSLDGGRRRKRPAYGFCGRRSLRRAR
jgi:hypothetical protein